MGTYINFRILAGSTFLFRSKIINNTVRTCLSKRNEGSRMAAAADAFALATRAHAEGNLSLAEQYSWWALGENPSNAEALHLLGLIARRRGDLEQAVDYFNRSLLCDGGSAVTWKNLGDAHCAAGNYR